MRKRLLSILMLSAMLTTVGCSGTPAATQAGTSTGTSAGTSAGTTAAGTTAGTTANSGEKPAVGATIYKFDDNFMSFVRGAIEKNGKDKMDLTLVDSQNDQAKQNEQVDTFISKGVKVLAINLVTPQAADAVIQKAKAADLPVIFFNKEPDKAAMDSYDKTIYIGTKSEESGTIQGQLVLDLWKANPKWDKNGDKKIQYVMLKGEPGHPDAEARTKYSIDTIKAGGVEVEELELQTGMWDTAKGKDLMDAWLSKHGDKIEFIISNNDAMALGALASCEAAGLTGDKMLPIVGVDAIPDALSKIEEGKMAGSVLNDAGNQGKAIVDVALNLAAGKDAVEGTDWKVEDKAIRVPYKAITKDNLSDAKKSYGQE